MRVLTWNLFHGRSQPPAGLDLQAQFASMLAGWDWDIALLQEVPPWWPQPLARRCGADHRSVLTSRNLSRWLRRAIAERRPDLIRSNGGGCNAVLARGGIAGHRSELLRRLPERRVAQLVRLEDRTCVCNYHGSARVALAEAELEALEARAAAWCPDGPIVLGGDLNLREPRLGSPGFRCVASRDVDHLFARGLERRGPAQRLDRHAGLGHARVQLSDHVPLMVSLLPVSGVRAGADADRGGPRAGRVGE